MRARIQRWGNSLAIRIPEVLATEAGLTPGTVVEIALQDGRLIVAPVRDAPLPLDQLIAGITDENLHGEIDTGPAVGKEAR